MLKLKFTCLFVLLLVSCATAKKRKNKSPFPSNKSKTKTKWSTSTDFGPYSEKSTIANEEHVYFVKRTFVPQSGSSGGVLNTRSPPYLAIPIAWLSCVDSSCLQISSSAVSGSSNALSEGFLCDDDCETPYEPICGRTQSEVAVFYNQCKLNVAKCRTHGAWKELPYEDCKKAYSKEIEYTDKKFRSSPYFKEDTTSSAMDEVEKKNNTDTDAEISSLSGNGIPKVEMEMPIAHKVTPGSSELKP